MNDNRLTRIYARAALCRAFETEVYRRTKAGEVLPCVYLSAGQEYVSATLSVLLEDLGYKEPSSRQIFIQHRAHSIYLSFGGDLEELALEVMGDPRGCAGGRAISSPIQSRKANIYGHDTLVGSQVPIAVGACYANRLPTLCFMGDATCEQDYALAALGWAATHRLPILFVVEDNNLSILTERSVRRIWSIVDVAQSFGLDAHQCQDDPEEIEYILSNRLVHPVLTGPALLNVDTTRLWWHAGAGIDESPGRDRHAMLSSLVASSAEIDAKARQTVEDVWERNKR